MTQGEMKLSGKNYSRNNSNGKRKKSDFYQTPYSMTRLFLQAEDISTDYTILEPCCGDGAITKVLSEFGYDHVTSYDISGGIDFLDEKEEFDFIVTNPPYSLSSQFVFKAKEVCRKGFAFLFPLTYLQGNFRLKNIWSDKVFPLRRIHVFSRYPMLGESLREDGKVNTGMQAYAWFVFLRGFVGDPTISWLDINDFIIRKSDRKVIN